MDYCRPSAILSVFLLAFATSAEVAVSSSETAEIYKSGAKTLESGNAAEALEQFEKGLSESVRQRNQKYELAFTIAIGNAKAALFRNKEALTTLLQARELSHSLNRIDSEVAILSTISGLYRSLGQNELALQVAEEGVSKLADSTPHDLRAQSLSGLAVARWVTGRREGAVSVQATAMREAELTHSPRLQATLLNRLGFVQLRSGEIVAAAQKFEQALTLIKNLPPSPVLAMTLRNAGLAALQKKQYPAALNQINESIRITIQVGSQMELWQLYGGRAEALENLGQTRDAIQDYEAALRIANDYRAEMIPVDSALARADTVIDPLADGYVRCQMQIYQQSQQESALAAALLMVEHQRARSLRQSQNFAAKLGPQYWNLLAELRTLQQAEFKTGSSTPRRSAVQAMLSRLENEAGLKFSPEKTESNSTPNALLNIRRLLKPSEALLSFWVGEAQSIVWVLTTQKLEAHTLPGREHLAQTVRQLQQQLESGTGTHKTDPLSTLLFRQISSAARAKPDWVLSLDGPLFELPFATLRSDQTYLIQAHSLRVIPSAYFLGQPASRPTLTQLIAVADPIYNSADPRLRNANVPAGKLPDGGIQLARLPSSSAEAKSVAQAWKLGLSNVLQGAGAQREDVLTATRQTPAALHLSLHVVSSPAVSQEVFIALGLRKDGRMDLLSATEIARQFPAIPLVVMSGCSSGKAQALPGAGLMGLTRAWLLAGSRSVVASYWPVPDDSGNLFRSFYEHISNSSTLSPLRAAQALQSAQLEMLRSGTWRSNPRFWGSYFLMGRS